MAIKLCIDPGHGYSNRVPGRYDPGATSAGVTEADIVLQWALTLKWVCGKRGVQVFLTRDDDRDPTPVGSRDNKAEAAGCTHFISLHCNSGGGTGSKRFIGTRRIRASLGSPLTRHYGRQPRVKIGG